LKTLVKAGAAAAMLFGLTLPGSAETYPSKPVKVVVPFAAGGGTDIFGRIWAEEMSQATGQRFLVENMPGAAGAIGTKAGIASPHDGYTLVLGVASTIAINPHTMGNIGYKPLTELRPISLLAYTPWIMVSSAKLPFKTVADVIAYGKQHPGELTFASWTATGEMGRKVLGLRTGVDLLPVPYDGAVAAMNDLVAGRASVAMLDLSSALPFINSGDVRPLAVTGPERSALMQDLPALPESGVKDMDINSWVALFAPAGTSDEIIEKLNKETTAILKKPEIREKLAKLGADVYTWAPQEVADFVKKQSDGWAKVIAETGGKAN
jgi:tripartite-type tricarboxylate transporter receptor subunit TctC